MLIPITSSAAQAAGVVAQSASKDKGSDSQAAASSANAAIATSVEQTGSSNPDRDAQGQGDGQPAHRERIVDENDLGSMENSIESPVGGSTPLPGEPPSQLDIVG